MGFRIKGANKLNRKLSNLSKDAEKEIQRELLLTGFDIEKETKEACPVDTGTLRASYTTTQASNKKSVTIHTNVKYGSDVEFGNVKSRARPHLIPAYNRGKKRFKKRSKQIMRKAMRR
jgi:HK97 gp10 family phage protein